MPDYILEKYEILREFLIPESEIDSLNLEKCKSEIEIDQKCRRLIREWLDRF